jgi:hypothetical protein
MAFSLFIKRPNEIFNRLCKNSQDFIRKNEFVFQLYCLLGSLPYITLKVLMALYYLNNPGKMFILIIIVGIIQAI